MQNNTSSNLVSHSIIYAAGNITRQLVGFIMLPIYTSYLSPADYGVIGLLTFAVSLTGILFGAQLVQAVPKYYYDQKTKKDKNAIVSTGLIITFSATFILTILITSNQTFAANLLFPNQGLSLVVALFAVLLTSQAAEEYGMTFIRIQEKPWLFISISLSKLIVQLSLNIWLVVVKDMGVLGVALSSAISGASFALLLTLYTLSKTGLTISKKAAAKMFGFCWPLWIGSLAAIYIGSGNRYYMKQFSSLEDIGFFELATKLSSILAVIIWQPFAQTWQTERFKIYQQNDALKTYQNIFSFISSLMLLACLGISIYADPIISIMAAPEFSPAIKAVPLLTLAAVFAHLTFFCNFSFHVSEQTKSISKNNYLMAFIITPLYLLLIPFGGYIGAAMAMLIAAIIHFVIALITSKKYYDMQLKLRPLLISLGIVTGFYTASVALTSDSHLWIKLAVNTLIIIAAVAAVLIQHWLDPATKDSLIIIKNKLSNSVKANP